MNHSCWANVELLALRYNLSRHAILHWNTLFSEGASYRHVPPTVPQPHRQGCSRKRPFFERSTGAMTNNPVPAVADVDQPPLTGRTHGPRACVAFGLGERRNAPALTWMRRLATAVAVMMPVASSGSDSCRGLLPPASPRSGARWSAWMSTRPDRAASRPARAR